MTATRVPPWLRDGAILIVLSLGLCIGIEGCSSLLLSAGVRLQAWRELSLTGYDAELGWVTRASFAAPEFWGPGRGLRTGRAGLRGPELAEAIPPGRSRALCSGDSFTFGEGVADENTWCQQLAALDSRLETGNLAVLGYGIDQSYLRYRRDAASLRHDLHLFAFIGGDLDRVGRDILYGYAKPRLRLEGDALAVGGVPVPRTVPAIARLLVRFSGELRSVQLARRALGRLGAPRPADEGSVENLAPLVRRILVEVAELSRARGATPVFVYLPVDFEIQSDGPWRRWTREALTELGYPWIDLTDSLRAAPPATAVEYFIPRGAGGEGHYSASGHAWAARAIDDALHSLPAVAARLERGS